MMELERAIAAAAESMRTQFQVLSAQYQHRGLRGGRREEAVREFLSGFLPAHVEAVSGEIFDATGAHSPECDIIVADRLRVPLIFGGEKRLVLAEGVYSVVEVKSRLDSGTLSDSLQKCHKVKRLRKTAYYRQTGAVIHVVNAYGKELQYFPTLFSVFAYTGTDPMRLIGAVEEYCEGKPREETLDSIVCLDGWLICWWDPQKDQYDLTSSHRSRLAVVWAPDNALLMFYLLYCTWLSQATCRPIRMMDYTRGIGMGQRIYPSTGAASGQSAS